MSDAENPGHLDINLLGKEYRVACPQEERSALAAAAAYVDGKMRDIAQRTRSSAAERIAVMAALNIAHEFLAAQNAERAPEQAGQLDLTGPRGRIADMEAQINALLQTPAASGDAE